MKSDKDYQASSGGYSKPALRPVTRRRFAARAAAGAGISIAALGLQAARSASALDTTPQASPGASPSASPQTAASPVADAVPDPNATFKGISPARADVIARLESTYAFEAPKQTGGDVIQVFSSDITMVNPMIAQDIASGFVTGLMYQELTGIDPSDGTIVPLLADSWEISSDGLRYRFALDPKATWHDGKPVTADDVVFSFMAMLAPDGLAPSRGTVDRALAKIEKLDTHTVELTSRQPMATFLTETALTVPIMPKHVWGGVAFPDWPSNEGTTGRDPSRVVGSGPFRFVEWVQNDHVTVTRNADYWLTDQLPVIENYIYRIVADSTSALQSLQTGEVDISGLSPAQAPAFIKSNPDLKITEYDRANITYYETNMDETKTTKFLDVRVRQAMLYALDRDLIAERIFLGFAVRADGPQPPLSPAYAPEDITTIYRYDPEKSKQLLDEAGWIAGANGIREKDGIQFTFDFTYEQDSATYAQLIPYMQEAWKAVGLEMNAIAMPFPAQQEQINQRAYDVALTGITRNTTGNQGIMYRCDSIYPAGFNEVKYCNPAYDKLDDQQREELDAAKRRDLLIRQSNILAEDIPMAPLVFAKGVVANSPRVHNYFPTGYSSNWSLVWAWVEQ
jgi:peptide/nickel transport system substrate-binding protein